MASSSCCFFIQLWLAWIGFELPFPVGFLHPINAFLIAGLCGWIVRDETQRREDRSRAVTRDIGVAG